VRNDNKSNTYVGNDIPLPILEGILKNIQLSMSFFMSFQNTLRTYSGCFELFAGPSGVSSESLESLLGPLKTPKVFFKIPVGTPMAFLGTPSVPLTMDFFRY